MGRFTDFLLMRNLPAHRVDHLTRAELGPLDLREAKATLQVSHTIGKPQWARRELGVFERHAYQRLALIFRCVNVLASAIAEAPLTVRDPKGEPDERHAVRSLITLPNPQMGEAMFWYNVAVRMLIYGYCVVEKERSAAGRVVALWPMNSELLKPVPRADGTHDWEYRVQGHPPALLAAEDVAVFRFAETGTGDPRGIGPLEIALREWSLLNAMQDYLKGFFDAGALPIYGLVLDPEADFDEDQAALIREMWVERTTWRNGEPPKPPIMESVKDIKRLSFDYNELAYIDLRDVSETAILTAFGIPGMMVGQRFSQLRNTMNNTTELRQSFYQDTVQKLWSRLDDVITRDVLYDRAMEWRPGYSVAFDTSGVAALQEDAVAKRAHALEAWKAGAITRAAYKRVAGDAVIDGVDDVYWMPFNMIEVPAAIGTRSARASVTVRDPFVADMITVMREARLPDPDIERRARGLISLETRGLIEQRAARLYATAGATFGPRIYAYFQEQKERVLAVAQRAALPAPERRDIADLLAIDWTEEADALDPIIRQLWTLMGETAAGETVSLLGLADDAVTWSVSNPWVHQVLSLVGQRVTGITETTRADIQRIVGEALTEGVTIDDLSQRLAGLYEETYRGRSQTIARTESQVAYNEAAVASYEASGTVFEAELLDNPKHTTDPGSDGLTCAERNGLIVPLAQVRQHIAAEHPNGSLAIAPVVQLGVV
jgi:HK97 family phage portal protein